MEVAETEADHVPETQFRHVTDEDANSTDDQVPATHAVHDVDRKLDHVPSTQLRHTARVVAKDSVEYVPALQFTQLP